MEVSRLFRLEKTNERKPEMLVCNRCLRKWQTCGCSWTIPVDEEKWARSRKRLARLTGYAPDLIAAERRRQKKRGWNATHDDKHTDKAIARNAVDVLYSYLNTIYAPGPTCDEWKLGRKYHDYPEYLLIVAAALIQAELERLNRKRRKGA